MGAEKKHSSERETTVEDGEVGEMTDTRQADKLGSTSRGKTLARFDAGNSNQTYDLSVLTATQPPPLPPDSTVSAPVTTSPTEQMTQNSQ